MSYFLFQNVSCNEITHLPVQIGNLSALKQLNLRKNLLVEIPAGELPLFIDEY